MYFNEKIDKKISEFMIKYKTNDAFRERVEAAYFNNLNQLLIVEIYALEEVLLFGNNGVYRRFLKSIESNSEADAIEQFDTFLDLYFNNKDFREYKKQQLKECPETLSKMELFAFIVIIKVNQKPTPAQEEPKKELEYDALNPILYVTDNQIKETLASLLFGEFIHKILDLPEFAPIKARQKEAGVIANIDKPFIIELIQKFLPGTEESAYEIIQQRFVKAKMAILLGKKEAAFEEYLKFNTNISAREILMSEKEHDPNNQR